MALILATSEHTFVKQNQATVGVGGGGVLQIHCFIFVTFHMFCASADDVQSGAVAQRLLRNSEGVKYRRGGAGCKVCGAKATIWRIKSSAGSIGVRLYET